MVEVDGNALGAATYGGASGLITTEDGEYDIEFYRIDADDQKVTLDQTAVNLADGEKVLVILSGDYETPSFTQHRFERKELEDHFRIFATSVINDR